MARRKGGQARQGRLQGGRLDEAATRLLEWELTSDSKGRPITGGTQGSYDEIENDSRRKGNGIRSIKARGERRRAVKRAASKGLRRQRHVEARRLIRGTAADRRSGLKPAGSREGRF